VDDWLPIDVPEAAALDGPWKLALVASPAALERLRAPLRALLPPWVQAGAWGAYSAGRAPPGDASAAITAVEPLESGVQWHVRTRDFDMRALHVLRSGLLHATVRSHFPEEDANELLEEGAVEAALGQHLQGVRLVVRVTGAESLPLQRLPGTRWPPDHADEFEGVLYPGLVPVAPFTVTRSLSGGSLRRCIVSFEGVADRRLTSELTRFVEPWGRLLESGCFEQPTELPGASLCDFAGVQVFERHSAEIVVNRFEADEAAWNALVNLLASFSARHPVMAVEIG
jgi:hypothetical protein